MVFSRDMPSSGIAGAYGTSFSFLKEPQYSSPWWLWQFRDSLVQNRHVGKDRMGQVEDAGGGWEVLGDWDWPTDPGMRKTASGNHPCSARSSARCSAVTWVGWVGGEVQEGAGNVYIRLMHFSLQQKLMQRCKATVPQLKQASPVCCGTAAVLHHSWFCSVSSTAALKRENVSTHWAPFF